MAHFDYFLNYFSDRLKAEISCINNRNPHHLYEPVCYSLEMGGKRIRPVLLLMAYDLFKPDIERAFPVAFAIELFHNFTLLHDDIMDNASLRRNLETVHVKYSENTAILSGDAMSILAYEYLAKCNTVNAQKVFELFTSTALKICEGQQLDMDFETSNNVSVDDYMTMIGLKTAVLLAASLKLGALVAGANATQADYLFDFGYNLGLAFQLQDDLLDTFGNTEEFGKNIGGDIVSNKKTFLLISAQKLASIELKKELERWIKSKNFDRKEKINSVKTIYNKLDIENITRQKIEYYHNLALDRLNLLSVDEEKKNELKQVANAMMNRKN